MERTQSYKSFLRQNDIENSPTAIAMFLDTLEGERVAGELSFSPIERGIAVGRSLPDGRIPIIINPNFSDERLMKEFKDILHRHRKGSPPSMDSKSARDLDNKLDEIKNRYQAYDLVEKYLAMNENLHQSRIKATIDFYSKIRPIRLPNNPAEDKRFTQIRRWHQKVKDELGDL